MLVIQLSVNVVLLAVVMMGCVFFGFVLRSAQLRSLKSKVRELEQEMLANHADILSLQRERAELEVKLNELTTPVIPLSIKDDKTQEQLTDLAARKKLAPQQPARKHS